MALALAKIAKRCLNQQIPLGGFGQTTVRGAFPILSFRQLMHPPKKTRIRFETLGETLSGTLWREVLPRVSDRIICFLLDKTLSETCYFTWGTS